MNLEGMSDNTRRTFLLAGLGFLLTGCQSGQSTDSIAVSETTTDRDVIEDRRRLDRWLNHEQRPVIAASHTQPQTPPKPSYATSFPSVLSRSEWAKGSPIPKRMNAMSPIKKVTVHHDGMPSLFWTSAQPETAIRLDQIRRSHQGNGWGDIGYHFVIDRAGRIWEGRPLRYQGAHVKYHNEGNLGIMCLGNFDMQDPTTAQLISLKQHLKAVTAAYGIGLDAVYTHQELRPTACPGKALQKAMVSMRSNGRTLI